MKAIHIEIIEKLIEAKKLEKEALMMLLPQKMQRHLEVISKELKDMACEYISDLALKQDTQKSTEQNEVKTHGVKKVDIG
ncbi:hypothetical protein [Fusibacter sp. 3D3]|uniref:hypothetical protein n=1 Tax=Fusibacter sp. 3D3 TaxID=1048380 RepID=UPI0008536745|nr:hypothetical protein [Fusibacter sp. 3D3]GAU76030.1 hypothetical protein F3D3_0626 [Fusibacter sp. 3D3]